ncbi:EamA family transporter, partial [archaeon]|nr:EamA family transporter [archaeon]
MQQGCLLLAISGIMYGTLTVGGQFFSGLGLTLFEIAFYRMLIAFIFFLSIALVKRKYLIKKEMLPFFAVYGLIGFFLELGQFSGIVLGVPIAIAALLLYSQPIWTVLLGKLLLKEEITRKKVIAVSAAFAGIIILLNPLSGGPV